VIKVRDVRPVPEVKPGKYIAKGANRIGFESRLPSVDIEKPHYSDIDFINDLEADEKFAAEAAAFVADDHAANLMVELPSQPIKPHKK
jgi:hypothetical protein